MKKQILSIIGLVLMNISMYCNITSQHHAYIDNGCVDLIIFSFDRPLQLYALLESVEKYVTGIQSISVVYRVSNDRYDNAFKEVQQAFPHIQLLRQKTIYDFKELTIQALQTSSSQYILFAVDDNIVKEHVTLSDCIVALEQTNAYGFYLKLGTHLTYCYTENCPQEVPAYIHVDNDIYAWNFQDGQKDWNYPNTVDMTLYRKDEILPIFTLLEYTNPNWLEAHWASWWVTHKESAVTGLFFEHSKIVNIPLNRVQNEILNRDMQLYAPQELLEKFEQGLKIDIEPLYQIKNNAVHTEYEPTFILRM